MIRRQKREESNAGGKFLQGDKPFFQFPVKQFEIDGFWDAGVAAGLQKTLHLGHHGVGGHRDDGDAQEARLLAHPNGEGESVFIAELDVEQDGVGPRALKQALRASKILGVEGFVPLRFQPVTQ